MPVVVDLDQMSEGRNQLTLAFCALFLAYVVFYVCVHHYLTKFWELLNEVSLDPTRGYLKIVLPDDASDTSVLGNPLRGYGNGSPGPDPVGIRNKTIFTRAVREDSMMSKVLMSNAPCSFIRLMISELRSNYFPNQQVEVEGGYKYIPVAWEHDTCPRISQNRVETLVSAEARSSRQMPVDSPRVDREFDLCKVSKLRDLHIVMAS
jgi:hypothetical protein